MFVTFGDKNIMELKSYQQTVINDIETFLDYSLRFPDLRIAFREYWRNKGVVNSPDYQNIVAKVPHVCVRVPTAGGKTFIAANAVRPIFDALESVHPDRSEFVIWLVPSLTILDQTVKNFSDPSHPYRQKLQTHFNGRVGIYKKQDVLQGADFSPDAVRDQLSIIVLSFDSLRTQNKEGRKAYQENGYLAAFATETKNGDFVLEDTDETALINVLRSFEPVLIVDESHNATSSLSVQMLADLNPSFILDLTATPLENSNIISYVDALQLKKQNMVKLPVIVNNFKDKNTVISSAVQFRHKLEEAALAEEEAGGKYIRPIVLFQAEPRTDDDNTTFNKIKDQLIEYGLPEAEIKIKTADKNELKDIDLMDRDCPVRYIITVNALKEGWDCPFAYILASLANKSSAVDVEQILGRILRQPYVRTHSAPLLNTSYVFTASGKFIKTLANIVSGLNRAGFSKKDFREKDFAAELHDNQFVDKPGLFPEFDILGENNIGDKATGEEGDEIDIASIKNAEAETAGQIDEIIAKTIEENAAYQEEAESIIESEFIPNEIRDKMNVQQMKEIFIANARIVVLPQFYIRINNEGMFLDEDDYLLENDELLKDFKLSAGNAEVKFDNLDAEAYVVDLEKVADESYTPTFKKMRVEQQQRFIDFVMSLPDDTKIQQVKARLCDRIGSMYPIADEEIKKYVSRVLDNMPKDLLRDCLEREFVYGQRIKEKIKELGTERKEQVFNDYLDTDKITMKPTFTFSRTITPKFNVGGITKSLYANEDSMNGLELAVINDIANLENVVFWHRNIDRSGFRINGFINHYPDFIVLTRNGKILVIETKGDDRDNSDSLRKIRLGKKWASGAGNNFKYMMIFDNQGVRGAFRRDEAISKISQM